MVVARNVRLVKVIIAVALIVFRQTVSRAKVSLNYFTLSKAIPAYYAMYHHDGSGETSRPRYLRKATLQSLQSTSDLPIGVNVSGTLSQIAMKGLADRKSEASAKHSSSQVLETKSRSSKATPKKHNAVQRPKVSTGYVNVYKAGVKK